MTPPIHKVILAAGGTGGHIYPAQALAAELAARNVPVALVTDQRGGSFEKTGATPDGETAGGPEIHRIRAGRLSRDLRHLLSGLTETVAGTVQARRLLHRLQAGVVVGFGSYATVPTMLAAAAAGYPTVIHEQNAVLGRANRMLQGRVRAIATTFETVAHLDSSDRQRVFLTGNPVRPAIRELHQHPYKLPGHEGPFNILIFGGSQGAEIFGDIVPEVITTMPAPVQRTVHIYQQCRPEQIEAVASHYRKANITATVAAFYDDLPVLLGKAHLVIARAGASTVAELTVAGRPAILVPFAAATDNHQDCNAAILDEAGAAWRIREDIFSVPSLTAKLGELFARPELLTDAARHARAIGIADAASRLADLVLSFMPGKSNSTSQTLIEMRP